MTCDRELVGVSGALGLLGLRSLRMASTDGSMTTRVGESIVSGSDGRGRLATAAESCSESCDLECVCIGENGEVDLNNWFSGPRDELDGEKGSVVVAAAAAVADVEGTADERRRFRSRKPESAFGSPFCSGPSSPAALETLPFCSSSAIAVLLMSSASTNSQSAVVGFLVSSITTRLLVRLARSPSGGRVNNCVLVGTKTWVKTRLGAEGPTLSPQSSSSSSPIFTSLSRGAMLLSRTSLTERRSWCDPQFSDLGRLVSDSVEELFALDLSRCRSSIFLLWCSRSWDWFNDAVLGLHQERVQLSDIVGNGAVEEHCRCFNLFVIKGRTKEFPKAVFVMLEDSAECHPCFLSS